MGVGMYIVSYTLSLFVQIMEILSFMHQKKRIVDLCITGLGLKYREAGEFIFYFLLDM